MWLMYRVQNHLNIQGPELSDPVVEGEDLCGADEGEVQGIEEKDKVLALIQTCLKIKPLLKCQSIHLSRNIVMREKATRLESDKCLN